MMDLGGRRGGGDGRGAAGTEMVAEEEDVELEEGEAGDCYGSEGREQEEEFVNPDELTYIDEKLRNVLGHFQTDFEDGALAENVGAKYGKYGTFLPTIQHSPSIIQSRSPAVPPKLSSTSRFPCNKPFEGMRQNPFGAISRNHTSAIDNTRNDNCGSAHSEKDRNPPKQVLNKVISGSEQKTLKVRIKVGNDDILVRNNAAIYSGLGLEISPSSSIGDSPVGSGAASPESRVMPDESPRTILKIMTCFSVPRGLLLSPLGGNVIEVREKSTPSTGKHKVPVKGSGESHRDSSDMTTSVRDMKDQMAKKMNSNEKEGCADMKIYNGIGASTTVSDKDIEPEMQDPSIVVGGMPSNAVEGHISNNNSSQDMMEYMINVAAAKRPKGKTKEKASKEGKELEEQSTSNNKEPSLDLKREYTVKDELLLDKVKNDSGDYINQSSNHMQGVSSYKATSDDRDKGKTVQVKGDVSGDKQKELLFNATAPIDTPRDNIAAKSSGILKGKKKSSSSRSDQSDKKVKVKPHRESSIELSRKSHGDNVTSRETSKDRSGNGNGYNHEVSGMFIDEPAPMPPAYNTTESAAAATAPETILINEEWVCCDKCEKWRLLPYGKNPDKFPKKWRCSMLDWLPGMNNCKISEDETTQAVRGLYVVPAAENNINLDGRHDIATSGITTATTVPTFEHSTQSMANLAEGSKSAKKLQAPGRSKKADDADYNPAVQRKFNKDLVKLGYKSSDVTVGKQISKHKQRQKSLGSSERVNYVSETNRRSKSKSGLVVDHDDLRASKKMKKEEFNEPAKHQHAEFEMGKNGPPTKGTLNNSEKYKSLSPGMGKYGSKVGACKRSHDDTQVFSNGSTKNSDAERSDQPELSTKKRKVKPWQLSQCGLQNQTSNQHALPNSTVTKEAFTESVSVKEKPMASRSEMKVSEKDDNRFHSNQVACGNLTSSRGDMPGVNDTEAYCGKGLLSYAPTSTAAAASSSSKVSSSHKSKADLQETRSSPVESVSSSPLKTGDNNLLDKNRRYAHGAAENLCSEDVDIVNSDNRKSEQSGCSRSKENYFLKSDVEKARTNASATFNGNVNPHGTKNGNVRKDEQGLSAKKLKEKHSGPGRKDGQPNSGMEHCSSKRANSGHKSPSSRHEKLPNRARSDQNGIAKSAAGKDSQQVNSDKETADNKNLRIAPSPARGSKLQPSSNCAAHFDASKLENLSKKVPNGVPHNTVKQTTLAGDASSPIQASLLLKEARDLKHMSKRLKDVGEDLESTSICFEAALKFLHVASLYEPLSLDSSKQGDVAEAMQLYSQTGELCGFCAREFERLKKMANAALAYKCMEVAYMKAAFCKHPGANKDRHALQAAPPMVPPGESPSSSASDVDNLNNHSTLAKAISAKGVNSPRIVSNHIARNNPHLERLLVYAKELNYAFEGNRKSHIAVSAYAAGNGKDHPDGVASIREVLDFNFHNVKTLLQLIRVSMEFISR